MADKFIPYERLGVGDVPNASTENARLVDMGDGTYAELFMTSNLTPASDGISLPVDNLAQTFSYNGDNTLNYIQVTFGGNNYRQTYTYSSGLVTNISTWVKQ